MNSLSVIGIASAPAFASRPLTKRQGQPSAAKRGSGSHLETTRYFRDGQARPPASETDRPIISLSLVGTHPRNSRFRHPCCGQAPNPHKPAPQRRSLPAAPAFYSLYSLLPTPYSLLLLHRPLTRIARLRHIIWLVGEPLPRPVGKLLVLPIRTPNAVQRPIVPRNPRLSIYIRPTAVNPM